MSKSKELRNLGRLRTVIPFFLFLLGIRECLMRQPSYIPKFLRIIMGYLPTRWYAINH